MIESDPTQGIKRPKAKTEHRRPWTDSEVEQFERAHPVGSKARLALALGLYTVQRLGDVIRMGRQHIQNGELTVRQNKTGTSLLLPVLPELQAIIDATPGEHLTFLVKKTGRPYCGTEFSGQFRAWCEEAGLPKGCTFHGLRATGCTRRADAGCSAHEIAAWSGHMTLKEVERYTKSANQKGLRSKLWHASRTNNCQILKPELSNCRILKRLERRERPALGHKRTSGQVDGMSALPPKADIDWLPRRHSNVFRFGIFNRTPELVIERRGRRKTKHHYCVACRRHQIVALFHHFPILAVIKPKLLPPIV